MIPILNTYISAGFIVTQTLPRPEYVSSELFPEKILSASGCIASFIPDLWTIEWAHDTLENRLEEAKTFDFKRKELAKIIEWVTPRVGKEIGMPNICFSIETAKRIMKTFLSELKGVKVLELGLHTDLVPTFCARAEPPAPEPGYAPVGRQGVHEAILKNRSILFSGDVLGFEPLVFNYSLSCSWLCNQLDVPVWKNLGIRPNKYGFIDNYEDALKCTGFISSDEIGAEPGLWLPWLIIDHTREEPGV